MAEAEYNVISNTKNIELFKQSDAFKKLKAQGFLSWGSLKTFETCYDAGDSEAQKLVQDLMNAEAAAKDAADKNGDSSPKNSSEEKGNVSLSEANAVSKVRNDVNRELKSLGDFKFQNGTLVFGDGSQFAPSKAEVNETQNKKFLKILNKKTMPAKPKISNLTADQIIKNKQAGMSEQGRQLFNSWAKRKKEARNPGKT